MNIWEITRAIKRSNLFGFRKLVNTLFYDPSVQVIPVNSFDYVIVDNFKFKFNDQVETIQRVNGNPYFAGIKENDIVLDIGANIGAMTIPFASRAKKVFSVEPLFDDIFVENIKANNVNNVTVLKCALGAKSGTTQINYATRTASAELKTFANLKEICGGEIDFLKCDCEGYEWCIYPEECSGIREIRFEYHIRREHQKEDTANLTRWCEWFEHNGYETEMRVYPRSVIPVVLFKKCGLIIASKQK